jgi:hypothetical protein
VTSRCRWMSWLRRDMQPVLAASSRVTFVENEVDDLQHGGEPARELRTSRSLISQPDSDSVRFARTMRWATVASEIKKALAISSVVRPQTMRSANAVRASRDRSG